MKLKPCPFCGSKDVSDRSWSDCMGISFKYVGCRECDAQGSMVTFSTKQEHIAAWNKVLRCK